MNVVFFSELGGTKHDRFENSTNEEQWYPKATNSCKTPDKYFDPKSPSKHILPNQQSLSLFLWITVAYSLMFYCVRFYVRVAYGKSPVQRNS